MIIGNIIIARLLLIVIQAFLIVLVRVRVRHVFPHKLRALPEMAANRKVMANPPHRASMFIVLVFLKSVVMTGKMLSKQKNSKIGK